MKTIFRFLMIVIIISGAYAGARYLGKEKILKHLVKAKLYAEKAANIESADQNHPDNELLSELSESDQDLPELPELPPISEIFPSDAEVAPPNIANESDPVQCDQKELPDTPAPETEKQKINFEELRIQFSKLVEQARKIKMDEVNDNGGQSNEL